MEEYLGVLDKIYDLEVPGKPIEKAAENIASAAFGEVFPQIATVSDVYSSVVEPFVAYAEDSGQYFTNSMARTMALNDYDSVDIVCFFGSHSTEIGMVFWENNRIISEEFVELSHTTIVSVNDQLNLLVKPNHGHPKWKQNSKDYYYDSSAYGVRQFISLLESVLKKVFEFIREM